MPLWAQKTRFRPRIREVGLTGVAASIRLSLKYNALAVTLALAGVASAEPGILRVLFLGHERPHYNSNLYYPILREALAPESIQIDYTTKVDSLSPENLQGYDAVLLYANHGKITPEQFSALNEFVEMGHGFVPVQCASACFGHSPEFVSLVGGRFKSHNSGIFQATVVNAQHPVMNGFSEFATWDETYVHSNHNENGRTVLMERIEGEVREPWTWVREQGKGRVFYTASGHDERTWKDAGFQRLLRNGIVWFVGDIRRSEWEEQVHASPKAP
jgi:type 1 glutamine amidotransferase